MFAKSSPHLLRKYAHLITCITLSLVILLGLLGFSGPSVTQAAPLGAAVSVGAGSYNTTLPPGGKAPSSYEGTPVLPKRTANVSGPMPTNDWWSSLGFQRFNGNPYSENMYPHPLALRAKAAGLGIGYANSPVLSGPEYLYPYTEEFTLGVAGLNSADTKVDGYSDWTVTAYWASGSNSLKATFGHGLPFVYATKTGGNALITFIGSPVVWSNGGNVLGVTINGHHYGLFAPAGSTWSISGSTAQSSLAGKDYFSVAALPDNTTATLNSYAAHAFAFITNTTVSWSYNQATAQLTSTFTATTTVKEGTESRPLMALYRHQWLNSSSVNTPYTYESPRGQMKVVRGNSFSTTMAFNGVLPSLPDMGTYDRPTLYNYVNQVYVAGNYIGAGKDTYWAGKDLGRIAMLVRIAEQVGHTAARDAFLAALKSSLQNWFSAPDGKTNTLFQYNSTWGTLVGFPAGYGSDSEINDHHFHYGYFILAAATIAQYDPAWASSSQWGGMVNMLIADAANISTASNPLFPRLRNFDPYAGHGWASGHAAFAAGNNQESSSESMMFNTAVILWGAATGNTTLRDLGIFLYTNETRAIEQYWFDVDNAVFPASYNRSVVGMVWGQGGAYSTWWTANPEEIHGINFLPFTGGSLYLGRNPSYITTNYNELVSQNGGVETEWVDIIWMFQALQNPSAAVSKFGSGNYTPEVGESKAHTYHWIHNLNAMGQLDTSVTANIPTYAVFNKAGVRTYVAYNPGSSAINVSFSNGVTCSVPARQMIASTSCAVGPTSTATQSPTITTTPGVSATPTITQTTPPATGNTFYVIDGASQGVGSILSANPGASAQTDTIPSAGGVNRDGAPANQLTYTISGVTGTYDSTKSTQFELYIDSLTAVGNGIQARVSYDFTGNGTWDRVETYHYFPTDPVNGWEAYRQTQGLQSASGAFANMSNGRVRIEVWNAIGNNTSIIRTSASNSQGQQSRLTIPYGASVVTPTSSPTFTPSRTFTPTATFTPLPTSTFTPTPTGDGSQLLSLNQPATASSNENSSLTPNLAVDGSLSTRWSSAFSDPQWLQVDLGSIKNITRVVLNWEAAYASAFQIQVSNDGANWTTVRNVTGNNSLNNDYTVSATGRYVRMYGTSRATPYGYSLFDFKVYGFNAPTATPTPACNTANNIALNKSALSSSNENSTLMPPQAVDGSLSTRWSSAFLDNQWIQVDLGTSYNVCQVQLAWEAAYASAYHIQVSNDGANWTTVQSVSGNNSLNNTLNINAAGRYVRVYGVTRATPYGISLYELRVFASGN